MNAVIRVLRLPVVLPIALVLIVLLPLWELLGWVFADGDKAWATVARDCIDAIERFVWP